MKHVLLTFLILFGLKSYGQNLESFKAPEPSKAYEFTKYDEMPPGDYTGIPNITIPLHTMEVDAVSIPLVLSYHAGGIKVNEEASNVGLGWNLNIGILSQTINGKDDLNTGINPQRLFKYDSSDFVTEWPGNTSLALNYQCTEDNFSGYNPSSPLPTSSTLIATGSCFPISGPTWQSYCMPDYNYHLYDMEPDIFRVNFFGESLKFIKLMNSSTYVVLNKIGYKIDKYTSTAETWRITTPSGDQYYFGLEKSISSGTQTYTPVQDFGGTLGTNSGNSYSRSWQLVKIITTKNKVINFTYNDYGTSSNITYGQNYVQSKYIAINPATSFSIIPVFWKGFVGTADSTPLITYVRTTKNTGYDVKQYVSMIKSDNQEITFSYSDRTDKADKKLDNITVKNTAGTVIKQFNFAYGYFTAPSTGNQVIYALPGSAPVNNPTAYEVNRLKLVSVTESGNNPYLFTYNSMQLPVKSSTAIDHWGNFNGQYSNTSIAPNPARFGLTGYTDNGNNNSAYINYTKACTLEQITFPTGGRCVYNYELNQYDVNLYETNMANADNVVSNHIIGGGLRVASISLYDFGSSIPAKKTIYTYSGGKSITPTRYVNYYIVNVGNEFYNQYVTRKITEFHGQNYYSPSPFGSITGIGYDIVTTENFSTTGSVGKTTTYFNNVIDKKPSNLSLDYYSDDPSLGMMALPAIQDYNAADNGTPQKIEIRDANDNLVQKKEYSYITKKSNLYYGNKVSQFRTINLTHAENGQNVIDILPQHLVGYYAIFGKHSLVNSETVTEYYPSGNKQILTFTNYNSNDVVTATYKIDNATGEFYREDITPSSSSTHLQKNILNLPVTRTIKEKGSIKETYTYTYEESGTVTRLKSIQLAPLGNVSPAYLDKITYELFDDKHNILQYYPENNVRTVVIWGYNKTLPIAKIDNITYTDIQSYVSALQSASNGTNEASLLQQLQSFRQNVQNLYPEAVITTYTYIPSIGLTSVTDPRGEKTGYTYDAYGRLKEVRDADGNVLSANEYYYKQ